MYPPQYPQQPQYPQYPQHQVPPAAYPAYPQQPQYAPPSPPPAQGTLSTFFDQPSAANKSWVFKDRPIGTTYSGIVARAVTSADIRQQTDPTTGRGQTYRDGRPKFVMIVPMLVQPSPEYPEGQASWWVNTTARDELNRAMAEAGAPEGPPEAGAAITVTFTGTRPVPGMNPKFLYRVQYLRPANAQPPVQIQPPVQQPAPMPVQQPVQQPVPMQVPQPAFIPPLPQPVPSPVGTALPAQVNPTLSPEQQALLAQLTGQTAG